MMLKIKHILLAVFAVCSVMIVRGQSQAGTIEIYYEDLYLTQRFGSVSPSDYIKSAKRPPKQTAVPDELHLTEAQKKQWKRAHSHLHVTVSGKDTIEMFRKYVLNLKPESKRWAFDTFIAIVDYERADTIGLGNGLNFHIYCNRTIMKPDTVFSQFVYDMIKYRDPDFVYNEF